MRVRFEVLLSDETWEADLPSVPALGDHVVRIDGDREIAHPVKVVYWLFEKGAEPAALVRLT